jgi:hypothetical protein
MTNLFSTNPLYMKKTSNGRRPQILTLGYRSNGLLDHTIILNLSFDAQTFLEAEASLESGPSVTESF